MGNKQERNIRTPQTALGATAREMIEDEESLPVNRGKKNKDGFLGKLGFGKLVGIGKEVENWAKDVKELDK